MNEKEILFKVLIVGDAEVGKTSFVRRYVRSAYEKNYKPTLGVDFALKVIPWSETQTVRLQLWDIAGQERFTSMTRVYYRRASACLILFDVTQPNSFHNAAKWKKDLDSKCFNSSGENIPCVLVANKIDLPMKVEKAEINDLCKEHKFLGWTEMSVKDDKHVTETMEFLVAELMSPSTPVQTEEIGYIGPTMPDPDDRKKSCCGS